MQKDVYFTLEKWLSFHVCNLCNGNSRQGQEMPKGIKLEGLFWMIIHNYTYLLPKCVKVPKIMHLFKLLLYVLAVKLAKLVLDT